MAHGDSLSRTVEATQQCLEERLDAALARHRDPAKPRDGYSSTDAFLAATSRHVAAVEAVLVPAARRVPGGHAPAKDYLHAACRLERTLCLVKARLYGEAHSIHLSWPRLWVLAREQLTEHNRLELELVERLIAADDPVHLDGLASRIFQAERRGPTRPHPYLPHTGVLSLVTRRVWAVADRFWDNAEGRVIPKPIRPAPHRHGSLVSQYLMG